MGYILYSLDADKFRRFVEQPSQQQLARLGEILAEGLEEQDGEYDDDDPIAKWPKSANALAKFAAQRLALPDWYGDLSPAGKTVWEGAIFSLCTDEEQDLGFRVEHDGIGWDVVEIAWKQLNAPANAVTEVALSAFGKRPFRCTPTSGSNLEDLEREEADLKESLGAIQDMLSQFAAGAKGAKNPADLLKELQENEGISGKHKQALANMLSDDDEEDGDEEDEDDDDAGQWLPMHSMHSPDEVARMQVELESIAAAIGKLKKMGIKQDFEALLPAVRKVAGEGRMLFVQVDT